MPATLSAHDGKKEEVAYNLWEYLSACDSGERHTTSETRNLSDRRNLKYLILNGF